jgi:tetratricopeptide (TPR) repeat protein
MSVIDAIIMNRLFIIISILMITSLSLNDVSYSTDMTIEDAGYYLNKCDYANAISIYNKVIASNPNNVLAYRRRAYAYKMDGNYENAIADYTKAINLDPKDSDSYHSRAIIYMETGDMQKSLNDFTNGINLDPKNACYYYDRSCVYEKKNDYDNAIADCNESIRINPRYANAYYMLGITYAKKGETNSADINLGIAIKMNPNMACYYELRGAVSIINGNNDRGVADISMSIKLNPNDPALSFEKWRKHHISEEELQYGETQVRNMLRDRPLMELYGEKALILYDWASQKYAGEDLGQKILWDSTEPRYDAEHIMPINGQQGRIRIRNFFKYMTDNNKEKYHEEMWRSLVGELYNITSYREFAKIMIAAKENRITKAIFVDEMIECESLAAEKVRSFYINVYLPWAKNNKIKSNPKSWYIAVRTANNKKPLILLNAVNEEDYKKYYKNLYDSLNKKGVSPIN